MVYLIIVSFIWAFSFGLIKGNLAGLDSNFVAFARLVISFLFFGFFLKRNINLKKAVTFMILGAVQFGLMYIFYIYSYNFLKAWQIAFFTILTPVYVTLIADIINRKFQPLFLLAAIISILGASIIVFKDVNGIQLQAGFVIIQLSNICFAVGQVYYRRIKKELPKIKDSNLIAWMYLGAVIISGFNSAVFTDFSRVSLTNLQIYTLFYLGIIASGISFFLWNYGATKVNSGTLAVLNNLKIPLAVATSIFIFNESGNYQQMILSGFIILVALYMSEKVSKRKIPK